MSNNISNLLDSAGAKHSDQLAQTRGLVSKWEKTGLLEGIGQEYDRSGMAVLLENQARQLIDENSATSNGSTSKEQWSGVALPLVRRVFGEIAAKDFVSVQPMNLPSGLVFFLDFKYGDTVEDTAAYPTPFVKGTDIMGNTNVTTDANGGLYGAGKFGYSLAAGNVATAITAEATASWEELGFNADLKTEQAAGTIKKVTYTQAQLTDASGLKVDTTAIGGIYVSSSVVKNGNVAGADFAASTLGEYAVLESNGNVSVFVRTEALTNAAFPTSNILFPMATTADQRSDFEDTDGTQGSTVTNDIEIPQVDVELRSEPIVAKTRKLKAAWSPEFAQDLNAYHSIDAEAELTSMLSEYISMEIDLEILDMLVSGAKTTDFWTAKLGEVYDSATNAFVAPTAAEAYTQFSWFQTLGTKIQKVSNKIHQKTLRGGANFIVCGPDVATIIESIPGYSSDTDGTAQSFAMGVKKTGALNSRFTVYKNPYMTSNTLLMGFRGTQFLETGAVYAPYIPLIMTPLVYDPTNFTPRKGVMTRYAKKMVRPEFYGKIHIGGLDRV
tara:strand:- start:24448 stop:26109 length:1662 start_codon:yes stop_codon:yes gene_type:complete